MSVEQEPSEAEQKISATEQQQELQNMNQKPPEMSTTHTSIDLWAEASDGQRLDDPEWDNIATLFTKLDDPNFSPYGSANKFLSPPSLTSDMRPHAVMRRQRETREPRASTTSEGPPTSEQGDTMASEEGRSFYYPLQRVRPLGETHAEEDRLQQMGNTFLKDVRYFDMINATEHMKQRDKLRGAKCVTEMQKTTRPEFNGRETLAIATDDSELAQLRLMELNPERRKKLLQQQKVAEQRRRTEEP